VYKCENKCEKIRVAHANKCDQRFESRGAGDLTGEWGQTNGSAGEPKPEDRTPRSQRARRQHKEDNSSLGGIGMKVTETGMIFDLNSGPIYSDLVRFSPMRHWAEGKRDYLRLPAITCDYLK